MGALLNLIDVLGEVVKADPYVRLTDDHGHTATPTEWMGELIHDARGRREAFVSRQGLLVDTGADLELVLRWHRESAV